MRGSGALAAGAAAGPPGAGAGVSPGGAGSASHFLDVFEQADVSGALAASVFHTGTLAIPDLKAFLSEAGQEMRL